MIRFILCEGKTDAILLSYYLEKAKGWEYNKHPKNFKIRFKDADNQYIGHYKNLDQELAICAVGGKDNFINFYKEHIEKYMVYSENEELEYKLAIVVDRDDRSTSEIEKYFTNNLSPCILKFTDREWTSNTFVNAFKQKTVVSVLGLIIPRDKQGALENILLDAISEDDYKGNLVNKSKAFVEKITPEASEIISTERLKLKTKLGVSLAVLYPEKVFSLIDEQLKSVQWEKSEILNECFGLLKDI